jgi:hypothetical protein
MFHFAGSGKSLVSSWCAPISARFRRNSCIKKRAAQILRPAQDGPDRFSAAAVDLRG